MCVCTQHSGNDLEEHEKFVKEVTKIMQEGRRAGAKRFHNASDLKIESGTADDEGEEIGDMCGPQLLARM